MSGYNTRTKFDNDYYNEFVNQQTNIGNYRINNTFSENNNKCNSLNGPRQNNYRTNTETNSYNMVDRKNIENNLRNLDIPYSKSKMSNTLCYKNKSLKNILNNKKINEYGICDNTLEFNYTRLNNDILDNKAVNINRFEFPIIDPTLFVYNGILNTEQVGNNRNGVNSRLQAKDNFIS